VHALEHLLNPRGIAVIGASNDPSRPGAQTVNALIARGYPGGIYPVNPKYDTLSGLPSFRAIADVPQPCDLAVIAVPAAQVPDMVAACGKRGVPFAVILGGGFRETGSAGIALEARLRETARANHVRLIGPNCLGLVNVPDKVYAGFGSLTRPPLVSAGRVSAVLQSGGFGVSLVMRCGAAGIGFRHIVTSGNETDISAAELIDAFVDDPHTRVILAYLEGIGDGRAFMKAARRALAAGKPLIVWKAGNSAQGLRAAASHTANMTGSYAIFQAAFRQCGVIEIHDVEDIVDYVHALLSGRVANGGNVAVMGGSGGSAVVFSDAADQYGLKLAPLAAQTQAVLAENLPSVASLENPIDFAAGFLGETNAPRFVNAVDAVLADPGIDQLALMLATVVGAPGATTARLLSQAAERHGKPIFVFWAAPPDSVGDAYPTLAAAHIPVMTSPNRVARTMGMLSNYGRALRDRKPPAAEPPACVVPPLPGGTLDESTSKQLLAAFGIPTTGDRIWPAAPIDAASANDLVYPVALKIISPDIAHKSDAGGVRLNVTGAAELSTASAAMLKAVGQAAPQARLTGLLVSPMVQDGLEAMVGVINDAVFGPVVAFGLGGIFAEALKDLTYRIAPFDIHAARAMIGELRSTSMFAGARGQRPRDTEALAATLVAVSDMAWQLRHCLQELDINPLLVLEHGKGVIAVDALAIMRQAEGAGKAGADAGEPRAM
jgi:acyl-CoA synthetase (NDP forming)